MGFSHIFTLKSILAIICGIPFGMIVGSIPGLTSNMALAIGVPLTFGISPLVGIPFLLALYKSSTYGGSISAILLNIPGTPAAAATLLDGYPLTKQGKAGKALKIALYSSVIGDSFSDIVLICVSAGLASVAMRFGPVEFSTLLLFALTFTGGLAGKSMIKGIISALLGLLFSMVGLDPILSQPRFDFGIFELTGGFDFIVVLIAMFTFSEVLVQLEKRKEDFKNKINFDEVYKSDNKVTIEDMKTCSKPIAIGSIIGTIIGALPGMGGSVACFLGYGASRSLSKNKDQYGKGTIEGVASAESANNAVCGANLVPLLSLGIPGNSAAAILGAALMIQGIRPGPRIFIESGSIIYAIFAGMLLANFFLLLLAPFYIKVSQRVISIPDNVLFPIIYALCFVGVYSINNSMFDVLSLIFFGILGYIMRKFKFPVAPFVIAFLLGPLAERSIRQSLIISQGDYKIFTSTPIAIAFLILTLISILAMTITEIKRNKS